MKRAVLVNGVPASGKSSVARAVAAATGWPLLTLDTIKEALFDELGAGDREANRALGNASYRALFDLARDFADGSVFIADVWFGFRPAALLEQHLARADAIAAVEIWCHAPPDLIAARYRARIGQRHAGHPGESYVPELTALAARATPLSLCPVIPVDTVKPLATRELLLNIHRIVERKSG